MFDKNMSSTHSTTTKVDSCHGNLEIMHNGCANRYHKMKYPKESFSFDTCGNIPNQQLLCDNCVVHCLICNNTHILGNDNASFI